MALTNCHECGHQVSDKAKVCPNCGYPICARKAFAARFLVASKRGWSVIYKALFEKSAKQTAPSFRCPACDSENVQKYSLWKKSQNRRVSGVGCLTESVGCLILVLLCIFAPLLLLLLGVGLIVALPFIIVVAVLAVIVYAIQESYESSRFICLRCENIFKP
jgi:predicted Zn-ribbon and HTH transcriptional regulator